MSADVQTDSSGSKKASATRFFLRGLAIVLPAVLTIALMIWIASIVNTHIVSPIGYGVRYLIAQYEENSRPTHELIFWDKLPELDYCGKNYKITKELKRDLLSRWSEQVDSGDVPAAMPIEIPVGWLDNDALQSDVYVPFVEDSIPYRDYKIVAAKIGNTFDERPANMPATSTEVYMEYVTIHYFRSQFLLSAGAVSIAIVLLYFIGRLVTVRLGAWVVHRVETLVLGRLPVISNVYSSAKQVTDFLFSERQIEYNRVVALEYPRRGIWSVGFVTGDSMLEITAAAGQPLVTVLIPTSPMPVTGYTMSVPRADILDLNMTIDQAFQFCVSCGVLIPPQQQITPELLKQELAKRLTGDALAAPKRDDEPHRG